MEEAQRFLRYLKILFIPTEGNDYRPRILERRALAGLLFVALAVEGLMAGHILAQVSVKDFLAAVFPASIEAFTNDERAALFLPVLSENTVLMEAAQKKAEDMATQGYFSHESPDGRVPWDFMRATGYEYAHAGENLAVHFYDSADVVSAWMASPTHRSNILKPVYTDIGIGIARGVYEGKETTFVVQFFGTPKKTTPSFFPQLDSHESIEEEGTSVPQVAGESISVPPVSLLSRVFGSPRAVTLGILSSLAVLVGASIFLAFAIKIQIQPVDMLAKGAFVLFVLLGLGALNGYMFASDLNVGESAAATIRAIEPTPHF